MDRFADQDRAESPQGPAETYTEKPEPLTAAIIADMAPGEERGDSQ